MPGLLFYASAASKAVGWPKPRWSNLVIVSLGPEDLVEDPVVLGRRHDLKELPEARGILVDPQGSFYKDADPAIHARLRVGFLDFISHRGNGLQFSDDGASPLVVLSFKGEQGTVVVERRQRMRIGLQAVVVPPGKSAGDHVGIYAGVHDCILLHVLRAERRARSGRTHAAHPIKKRGGHPPGFIQRACRKAQRRPVSARAITRRWISLVPS